MAYPGVSKRYFPPWTSHVLFCQNTHKTGNNALEKSQAFHNITRFERIQCHSKLGNECFTIKLFYSKVPIFYSSYGGRR